MSTPDPVDTITLAIEKALHQFDIGDVQGAMERSEDLLAQYPSHHGVLCLAAGLATAQKRFADADRFYNRALASSHAPHDQAISWNGLGRMAKLAGNLDAAEEAFRRALMAEPGEAEHAQEFADILATRGKFDSAVDVMRSSINRFPRDPNPCIMLGNLLMRNGRHKDALAFYDMALRRDPNSPSAHFNACIALTVLGKLDAARTACETALRISPEMAVYYQLASLGALTPDDPRIPGLEARAADHDAPLSLRIDAGFALAKAYDDAGDAGRAFPHLREANRLKRSTIDYHIDADRERTDKIIALFTKDFFRRFASASDAQLAPIFILGMPRSGSTVLEQMLAGHSQVRGGGELPHMAEIARGVGIVWGDRGEASPGSDEQVTGDLRQIAAEYTAFTRQLQGKEPHFTDKLPGNFMFLGLIHLAFPNARIIHSRRDAVDTCLSSYQRLYSSEVPYCYDLSELGQYHRLYQRLMEHWHSVLPAGRILDVDYESLVVEPEKELRRILDFCGLEFEASCLDFQNVSRGITTASAVQVRKPLYNTSVQRWKKYGADLGPLLAALGMEPSKG